MITIIRERRPESVCGRLHPSNGIWALVVAAGLMPAAAGCDATWRQRWTPVNPGQQQTTPVPNAVTEGPPSMVETGPTGTDARVAEARSQVLAFIGRLGTVEEKAEQTDSPVEPERHPDSAARATGGSAPGDGMPALRSGPAAPDESGGSGAGMAPVHGDEPAHPVEIDPSPTTVINTSESVGRIETGGVAERRAPRVIEVSIRHTHVTREEPQGGIAEKVAQSQPTVSTDLANRPVSTDAPREAEQGIDALLGQLEARVTVAPNDVESQWRLAMLRLALNEESGAEEHLSEMVTETGALLREAVRAMSATRRALLDPVRATGDAVSAVDALRAELAERAPLTIPTVALCDRVQAFGIYDEFPDSTFRAHTQYQAIVYFEVENFKSERTAEGRYRTLLSERLEVLTHEGDQVWEYVESNIEDTCQQRRRDFFVAQRIQLPQRLPPGEYVLKVTIVDLIADQRTQAIHPFRIAGAAAVSASTP